MKNKMILLLTGVVLLSGTMALADTAQTNKIQQPTKQVFVPRDNERPTDNRPATKDWSWDKDRDGSTTTKQTNEKNRYRDIGQDGRYQDKKGDIGRGDHNTGRNREGYNHDRNKDGSSWHRNQYPVNHGDVSVKSNPAQTKIKIKNNDKNNGNSNGNGNAYGKNNVNNTYVNKNGDQVIIKKNPAQTQIKIKNK